MAALRVVDGDVLTPGDAGFDEARSVWNERLAFEPSVIVRCVSAADVLAGIDHARREGLAVSIKGGGHSYGLTVAEGSLLLDLSNMKALEIAADAGSVTIGPGVTCADLDAATESENLGVTTPTASSVGVIGAALGGGTGWLSRVFGHTLDNVRSLVVATADGEIVTANQNQEPELFWGMRGAGANLGVTLVAELDLHHFEHVMLAGQVIYPLGDAVSMLSFFRDFMEGAPNGLQCLPFMFRVPPIEPFPEEYHGQPALDFVVGHTDIGA